VATRDRQSVVQALGAPLFRAAVDVLPLMTVREVADAILASKDI
jgi:hypothetical protein